MDSGEDPVSNIRVNDYKKRIESLGKLKKETRTEKQKN